MKINRRISKQTFASLNALKTMEIRMEDITPEKAAIALVGLWALRLVGKASLHLLKTFLRPGKKLKKLGKWAVVTGATGKFSILYP